MASADVVYSICVFHSHVTVNSLMNVSTDPYWHVLEEQTDVWWCELSIEHGHDVRMTNPQMDLSFSLQPNHIRIRQICCAKFFKGDFPKCFVLNQKHRGEPTVAEKIQNSVIWHFVFNASRTSVNDQIEYTYVRTNQSVLKPLSVNTNHLLWT